MVRTRSAGCMRHGAERRCGCHKLWLSAAEHYRQLLTQQISGFSVYEFPAAFSVDGAPEDYEVKFSLLFLHGKVVLPDSCCTSHSSLCSRILIIIWAIIGMSWVANLAIPAASAVGRSIGATSHIRWSSSELSGGRGHDSRNPRGLWPLSFFAEKHTRIGFTLEVRILKTKLSMYW